MYIYRYRYYNYNYYEQVKHFINLTKLFIISSAKNNMYIYTAPCGVKIIIHIITRCRSPGFLLTRYKYNKHIIKIGLVRALLWCSFLIKINKT